MPAPLFPFPNMPVVRLISTTAFVGTKCVCLKRSCVSHKALCQWKDFTNCGVRHLQDPVTKEITLDQIAFAQNHRKIAHPELSTAQT